MNRSHPKFQLHALFSGINTIMLNFSFLKELVFGDCSCLQCSYLMWSKFCTKQTTKPHFYLMWPLQVRAWTTRSYTPQKLHQHFPTSQQILHRKFQNTLASLHNYLTIILPPPSNKCMVHTILTWVVLQHVLLTCKAYIILCANDTEKVNLKCRFFYF